MEKIAVEKQIIKPIDNIENIDEIISISKNIEERRNDLAYSSPVEEENILREEVNQYFKIKKIIEGGIGDLDV